MNLGSIGLIFVKISSKDAFPYHFTFHRHFIENEQTCVTIQSFGANISGVIPDMGGKFGCIM